MAKIPNRTWAITNEAGLWLCKVFNLASPVNMAPFERMAEELKAVAKMTVNQGESRTEIRYWFNEPFDPDK